MDIQNDIPDHREAVLIYPLMSELVSLGVIQQGVCAGKLNGYGGMREHGEDLLYTAEREFKEETGAVVSSVCLTKVAYLRCHCVKETGEDTIFIHVYFTRRWIGEIVGSAEVKNTDWYHRDELPYDKMMVGDRDWLPLVLLHGKKVIATIYYNSDRSALLKPVEIEEVENFEM